MGASTVRCSVHTELRRLRATAGLQVEHGRTTIEALLWKQKQRDF